MERRRNSISLTIRSLAKKVETLKKEVFDVGCGHFYI